MGERSPEDLSVEELHRLLVIRRSQTRRARLERFRRVGRAGLFSTLVPGTPPGSLPKRPKRWFDYVLFGVEALALLGLAGIVLGSFSVLRQINVSAAAAFRQPTLTPTPLILAVVLPDGHTPPNAAGEALPNEAEIPPHLLPLVQSLANLPIPTPASEQAVRIQVPAIGVDAPVVQGDGWEQLKKGVAQHLGTPNPGQNGNVVLAGHNDVYGEVFRDLDRLMPGDKVILFTVQQQYTYVITGTKIVMPTQVEVMDPTPNATLTLISCHPYRIDNHRIVVSAILQTP